MRRRRTNADDKSAVAAPANHQDTEKSAASSSSLSVASPTTDQKEYGAPAPSHQRAPRVAAAASSSLKGSLLSRRLKCGAFVLLWLVVPLGLLGTGFYAVYLTMEENYCANTYMRPVYLPMNLTSSSPSSSPSPSASSPGRYSLYLYREGNVHGKTPWKRKGVPVLFIPGNGGVYGQVRSFASEAARHALQARKLKLWTNEIDFFTVHFREELSALHGDLLVSQTEYVNAAIQHILRLYQEENGGGPSNNKPTSVILVGHSMGGLVARAVFTLRSYIKGSVNTIITLNSPHRLAPILVDRRVAHFYDYVNAFWKDRQTNKDLLEDVAIVSIAGSFRDSLILSELCNMEGLVPFTHGYSILTTSIPNVRVQVDHQCIVWCNSVVKAMTETLYGLVDPTTRQATLPLSERVAVLERGFYSFVPEKLGFSLPHQTTRQLPSFSSPCASSATNEEEKGVKIMQSQTPRLRMSSFQDRSVSTFRFELTQEDEDLSEFVMFTNLQPGTDFNVILLPIDAHKPQINATGEGFTVPEHGNAKSYEQHIKERDQKIKFQQSSSEGRKKQYYIIHLSSERLREYGSVELRFTREATGKAPDSFFVEAETSIASPLNRMEVPHYPWQQTHLWLDKGRSSALSNISLPKEDHRYPLFFSAQVLSCDSFDQQSKQEPLFLPLLYTLVTPMASESFYSNATFVSLKFHEVIAKDGVRAIFFSDPSCSYQLTLRPDLVGMVGRMLATYIAWPIGFAIIVFYIILSQQLYFWSHRGQCPSLLLTSKLFLLSKVSLAVLLLPPFLEYMILSPASSLFADSFISLPATLSECVSIFHNGLFNSFFAIFTSSTSSSSASSISTWLRTSKHSFQDLILVPPAWMFPVFYLFGYFLYFTILLIVWMLQYLLLAPFCRRLLISSSSSSSSSPSKQHQERAIQATKNNTTNEKEKKEQRKLPKQQKTDDIRWQSMFSLVVGLVVVATLLWTAHSYIALVFVFLFFFVRFSYNIAADQPTPQNKSLHSYQQAVLLTVVPCLMMLTPAFIIWVNHLPVEWRTLDSNEPLVLMLYVHLCFASFSLPMPPKGTRSRYSTYALIGTLLATTIFVVGYCTFQFYRLLDVTLAIALMFCYAHAVNLFFIPPS